MRYLLALLLSCFLPSVAQADERISICFNYGCAAEETARFSEGQLSWVKGKLASGTTAEQERQALSLVIGKLYHWAGRQTPIYVDKGGNTFDGAENGMMDCIDHSTTTTRLLKMLERRGWLRYHHVLEPARRVRGFIFQHFSAVIEENDPHWLPKRVFDYLPEAPDEAKADRYVVDSWFVSNGMPAVIMPLDDWLDGGGSIVEPN